MAKKTEKNNTEKEEWDTPNQVKQNPDEPVFVKLTTGEAQAIINFLIEKPYKEVVDYVNIIQRAASRQ